MFICNAVNVAVEFQVCENARGCGTVIVPVASVRFENVGVSAVPRPRFVLAALAVAPPVPPEASGRGVERLRLDSDRVPVPSLVVLLVTLFGPAAPVAPVGPCGPDIESVKAGASGCDSVTAGPSPCCTDKLNFGTSLMTTVVLTGS